MSEVSELQSIIEEAFERRADINPRNADAKTRDAVNAALNLLNQGKRVATQHGVGNWEVNQWLKRRYCCHFA